MYANKTVLTLTGTGANSIIGSTQGSDFEGVRNWMVPSNLGYIGGIIIMGRTSGDQTDRDTLIKIGSVLLLQAQFGAAPSDGNFEIKVNVRLEEIGSNYVKLRAYAVVTAPGADEPLMVIRGGLVQFSTSGSQDAKWLDNFAITIQHGEESTTYVDHVIIT